MHICFHARLVSRKQKLGLCPLRPLHPRATTQLTQLFVRVDERKASSQFNKDIDALLMRIYRNWDDEQGAPVSPRWPHRSGVVPHRVNVLCDRRSGGSCTTYHPTRRGGMGRQRCGVGPQLAQLCEGGSFGEPAQ